jgi:Mrp family chromosome partitioning ATPase
VERIRKALELAKAEREQSRRQGGDAVAEPAPPGFETLRAQVLQRMAQHGWSTLAVVGPGQGVGTTFTAINLAIAIAADPGCRALLVDLDLRSPSVHRRFGFEPQWGLDDCLRGKATPSMALVRPEGYPRLRVLPVRSPIEQPFELLSSTGARELLGALRPQEPAQYAIYDLPPFPGSDDALAVVPPVDAALVVIGDSRTRRDELQRCVERLRGIPVLGSVLIGAADASDAAAAD